MTDMTTTTAVPGPPIASFFPDPAGQVPDTAGYFGAFGGKFIPEALVAAVEEVAAEFERAKADPEFAAELDRLLVHYTGRPSQLTRCTGSPPRRAAPASSSSART